MVSIAVDDSKIRNVVIKDSVSTIDSNTNLYMHLNLKVNVKVTKYLFSKMEKNSYFFLSNLNLLISNAEDDKRISYILIKDIVSYIDRKTKIYQEFKFGGQGHTMFFPKSRKTGKFS